MSYCVTGREGVFLDKVILSASRGGITEKKTHKPHFQILIQTQRGSSLHFALNFEITKLETLVERLVFTQKIEFIKLIILGGEVTTEVQVNRSSSFWVASASASES